MKNKRRSERQVGSTVEYFTHPHVEPRQASCPKVLTRERVFLEAHDQCRPLIDPQAPHVDRVARFVCEGNANPRGLRPETAHRQATAGQSAEDLYRGANPNGKLAEVIAASDYRELHAGRDPGIVNPPQRVAGNVRDIRLSPDPQSRKDLVFGFETPDGRLVLKYNGQVKTGRPQYVADSLVEMARTPGYGKIGYVDARYANPDGSPRVAADAFTEAQARKLQKAGVRLRGIKELESRAQILGDDLRAHKGSGLSPRAQEELRLLREDIANAYRGRAVAGRIMGGAAAGAVAAAVVSLAVQLATEGEVDVSTVKDAASVGAAYGAGGAAADAALYHAATKALDMTPEAAKAFAQNGVAVGFCLLAVGMDLADEAGQYRRGQLSRASFVAGASAKVALDVLPLLLAPLGLPAAPVLIGAQVGGRWLVSRVRQADADLERAIQRDYEEMENLHVRMDALSAECDETDVLFAEALNGTDRSVLRLL